MKDYETVFILTPVLSEAQMKDAVEKFKGVFNCTAPNPVRARDFSLQLGAATNSKLMLRVPSVIPRLFIGQAGAHLNSSQRVTPYRLQENGVRFIFEQIRTALEYEYT